MQHMPASPAFGMPLFRGTVAPLPQGSLASVRVLLSRSILAYYDPIRQPHRHAATLRYGRLYAAHSLGGSASATRGTFPAFDYLVSIAKLLNPQSWTWTST
jgi:hypothetical protein